MSPGRKGSRAQRHGHSPGRVPGCARCERRRPFTLPPELLEAVKRGEVVLFAGAGVSTEARSILPKTLYEEACADLGLESTNGLAFADLMTRYCNQTDGRARLLRRIRDRFDYIGSFPELYRDATEFHAELATLYMLDTVVTTNWDDYFELECGATPFVTADDFAFWNVPGRKVVKFHGSVSRYGSLVATRKDYERCYRRLVTGLIGSTLRHFLATRTILYAGFSFRDDDILRVHRALTREMAGVRPNAYIITLDQSEDARLRQLGLTPIYTDATYFLEELKARLVKDDAMIPDKQLDGLRQALSAVRQRQLELFDVMSVSEHPDLIVCVSYQDGLKHGFERMLALRNTGQYSDAHKVHRKSHSYAALRKEAVKARRYDNVAYIDGYINAHIFLRATAGARRGMPLYYVYGHNGSIRSLREYRRVVNRARQLHAGAYRWVRRLSAQRFRGADLVYHHPPYFV